ncbi:MAG: DegT/DnrJ/EryC1/StrS family aminotransferase [Gemmatimonadota bacterium]
MTRTAARHVPLIQPDLPAFDEVAERFREILENGRITNFGRYVTEFERQVGEYVGGHAVTTSSGTMGLLFTLQALGLARGARVIMPSFTFMATAQAIVYAGGIPVFADIGEDLTIDSMDLASLLDQHRDTAMVVPVHMYGLPCDTDAIENVVRTYAGDRQIRVIYDAAHAFGAARNRRPVGISGDAEVFSLSVTKVLVSVEGGLVTSRDAALVERLRHMRNYGIESNYDAWYPGLNGKMSEFHAIVGLANLARLDERMETRQHLATIYADRVHERTEYRVASWPADVRHTFKDFTVLVPDALAPKRDQLIARLKELGIETRAYFYPPVHEQRAFRKYADRALPRTESLARRVLTLPFFTRMSEHDIDYVVDSLQRVQRELT